MRKNGMHFKTTDVEDLKVFYREAGSPWRPTVVLLDGFLASSYQFHELIPLLVIGFMSSRGKREVIR
jgi:hypothetical protein